MKNIFKSRVFFFILGAILFGGIAGVTAYTIAASEIEYNGSSVETALNNLYEKAKPDYSGDTTFTPSTSSQTISTNNKKTCVLNGSISVIIV